MTIIREMREKTGESLTAVAIRAGIEPALMSMVERGKKPNQRNAKKIAEALRVDVKTIFPGFDDLRSW